MVVILRYAPVKVLKINLMMNDVTIKKKLSIDYKTRATQLKVVKVTPWILECLGRTCGRSSGVVMIVLAGYWCC